MLDSREGWGSTRSLQKHFGQLSHRDRAPLAKMNGLAFDPARGGGEHKRTGSIGNEGQVSLRREIPQLDFLRPLEGLREHRGYHSACRLPGPIGIERPQRDHWQIKAAMVSLCKLV